MQKKIGKELVFIEWEDIVEVLTENYVKGFTLAIIIKGIKTKICVPFPRMSKQNQKIFMDELKKHIPEEKFIER